MTVELYKFPISKGVLMFGPCPTDAVLTLLRDHKTTLIWNLARELAFIATEESTFVPTVLCSNIQDFSTPPDNKLFLSHLAAVMVRLYNGETVFIHCLGGRDRTGMALAAIYMFDTGCCAKDAVEMANKHCGGPTMKEQVAFVSELEGVIMQMREKMKE